jgi:hypothetical protein
MKFPVKFPPSAVEKLEEDFSQQYLDSKAELLRDKVVALKKLGVAPAEIIERIEGRLDALERESNLRQKANLYELAHETYVLVAPIEDVLGEFLGLRSRIYRLDKFYRQIWPQEKLDQIEADIRQGNVTAILRVEVESISRAIYECGFRYTRDKELKSELVRGALWADVVVSVLVVLILMLVESYQVSASSPFQEVLSCLFGVSGGLLSATLQLRKRRFYRHDLRTEQVGLLFRAVFGGIAAIIVILSLKLRVVDFPFLHSIDNAATLPPTALYVVGFASGFTERIFFGAMDKVSTRSGEVAKDESKAP